MGIIHWQLLSLLWIKIELCPLSFWDISFNVDNILTSIVWSTHYHNTVILPWEYPRHSWCNHDTQWTIIFLQWITKQVNTVSIINLQMNSHMIISMYFIQFPFLSSLSLTTLVLSFFFLPSTLELLIRFPQQSISLNNNAPWLRTHLLALKFRLDLSWLKKKTFNIFSLRTHHLMRNLKQLLQK